MSLPGGGGEAGPGLTLPLPVPLRLCMVSTLACSWGDPGGDLVGDPGAVDLLRLPVGTVQPGLVLQLTLTTWGTGLSTLSVSAWVGSGSSPSFPVQLRL